MKGHPVVTNQKFPAGVGSQPDTLHSRHPLDQTGPVGWEQAPVNSSGEGERDFWLVRIETGEEQQPRDAGGRRSRGLGSLDPKILGSRAGDGGPSPWKWLSKYSAYALIPSVKYDNI